MNGRVGTSWRSAGIGLIWLTSCHTGQPQGTVASHSPSHADPQGVVHSNIARADYAGSETCAGCHEKEYAAWLDSPMHRMTRDLQKTRISAPFTGSTFDFRGDSLRLEQIDGQRLMRLQGTNAEPRETLFRVTKVIGGRYREDFVGVEVDPASPL